MPVQRSHPPQSPLASHQQGTRPCGLSFGVSPIDSTSQGFASAMTEGDDARVPSSSFRMEFLVVVSSFFNSGLHPMGRT